MERTGRACGLGWAAAGILCLAAAQSSFAEDRDWKISSSLDFETGDFGTGTRSDTLYVPFTLKRTWGDWDASVTLPFLHQRSGGQVTNVGGKPVMIGKTRGSTAAVSHAGLGDVVLRGSYALVREEPRAFDLSLVGKIKLPTADKDKGLGTGESDEGLGVEFGKRVVADWTVLADLYYTIIGSPAGTDLDNQWAVDFGVAHQLGEVWTATALCELSNPLVAGEPAPAALRANVDYGSSEQLHAFTGVLLGLSDGSPDFGLSLGGSYRF